LFRTNERMRKPKVFDRTSVYVILWLDSGFTGVQKDYPEINIMMPKKKPKGKELTDIEKIQNKAINSARIVVEHVIGGIKRFRIDRLE